MLKNNTVPFGIFSVFLPSFQGSREQTCIYFICANFELFQKARKVFQLTKHKSKIIKNNNKKYNVYKTKHQQQQQNQTFQQCDSYNPFVVALLIII